MTTRLSHPWYNLVDAIHACYNLVFSVWVAIISSVIPSLAGNHVLVSVLPLITIDP